MNKSRLFLLLFLALLALLYVVSLQGTIKDEGTVTSFSSFDDVTIITLEGFDEELVVFGESPKLSVGDTIRFEGVKGTYQGRAQIEVRKLFVGFSFVLKEYTFKH